MIIDHNVLGIPMKYSNQLTMLNSMDSEDYSNAKREPLMTQRQGSRNSLAVDSTIHSVYKRNKSPSDTKPNDDLENIDNM